MTEQPRASLPLPRRLNKTTGVFLGLCFEDSPNSPIPVSLHIAACSLCTSPCTHMGHAFACTHAWMHACAHQNWLLQTCGVCLSSGIWFVLLIKGEHDFFPLSLSLLFFLKWAMSSSAPLVITNLVGRYREGEMESGSREKRVNKTVARPGTTRFV